MGYKKNDLNLMNEELENLKYRMGLPTLQS
ncbi:hypothetical protein F984_02474 [Acinetobacter nosocomialis NIPH 2119]|uniref:Uncharacterized protein n=1 Tax=Acinetobacter nosocomialis TaxID=106654 RepID=A0A836MM50_ACINO|nr:hypothetical protein W9I_00417 [Acinetobacter nosocomialis Ab22222]ENU46435.1 hypothetical protein F984_02474 [Acinetobacter nosocomialis NIPH 2119]KDM58419.1 hypothetical protein AE32_00423 [Acinetobacter nosocomialis]SSO16763.1 Uncharacterised protein [Acinetobacter nosocomialis]SSQ64651.1 Uncharacterised protein [Acinetobacter nosocomialis]